MRALLAVLVVGLVACASRPDEVAGSGSVTEPQTASEPPATKATGPVIAKLATNSKKVDIIGGSSRSGAQQENEVRVVVRNNEGTILADGLTLPELRRFDPLLGVMVTDAVASNSGTGTYVDATLTLPERHRTP